MRFSFIGAGLYTGIGVPVISVEVLLLEGFGEYVSSELSNPLKSRPGVFTLSTVLDLRVRFDGV